MESYHNLKGGGTDDDAGPTIPGGDSGRPSDRGISMIKMQFLEPIISYKGDAGNHTHCIC